MAALIAPLLTTPNRPFDRCLDDDLEARFEALDRLADIPTDSQADSQAEAPVAVPEFEVVLVDGSTEAILGASAYAQEGQMTTFFRTGEGDPIIDAWSERLTSIRTTDIKLIRRRPTTTP